MRQLELLSDLPTDVFHLKEAENLPTNTLSRSDVVTSSSRDSADSSELSRSQVSDEELRYLSGSSASLQLRNVLFLDKISLVCDT